MQVQSVNTGTAVQVDGQRGASTSGVRTEAVVEPVALKVVQPTQAAIKPEDVDQAVKKLNETVKSFNQGIQFSVDEDTKINLVKIVELESKKVIRQIPTEEAVQIAKAIDRFQGLLIRDKA